ncbi:retrovirus-related Pol polyprotein from transposon 297 [Nephila pilipes]|uniref:RNA-directed DNA polymerase n=1 Tax=Nephila pilipes TaxID=299642 RepID=A0A8X6MQC4_NEPPI|nr:retrovirus-related Pol polyprotein from transposon 297 [Nephila pilipes]
MYKFKHYTTNDQLDKLAEMADGIMAVAGPPSSIHMIDAENQDLRTKLLEISSRLSRLETRERSTSRGPEGCFRRHSSSTESGAHKHYWYHRRFKECATKCRKPLTAEGISPLPEKVAGITNFPNPETVKERRRFLAICNFYRRFIPHAARTQAVLNSYLKGAKKNVRTPILWTEKSVAAFEKSKKDLEEATVLYHPSADASFAIVVDASDAAVGAALHQQTSTGWQPLAFFSKTLSLA